MRQEFLNLQIETKGSSLYEFTNKTINWIKEKKLNMTKFKKNSSYLEEEDTQNLI